MGLRATEATRTPESQAAGLGFAAWPLQTHPHATLAAAQCYPEHLLLLFPWGRRKALEVGLVPPTVMLLQGTASAPVPLVPGCQISPSFHAAARLERCLGNLGVQGRADTPHNTTLPLRLGASPENLVWGLS